jgi:hypothetical protein
MEKRPLALGLLRLVRAPAAVEQDRLLEARRLTLDALALEDEAEGSERDRQRPDMLRPDGLPVALGRLPNPESSRLQLTMELVPRP